MRTNQGEVLNWVKGAAVDDVDLTKGTAGYTSVHSMSSRVVCRHTPPGNYSHIWGAIATLKNQAWR